jgi:hypothetical protein
VHLTVAQLRASIYSKLLLALCAGWVFASLPDDAGQKIIMTKAAIKCERAARPRADTGVIVFWPALRASFPRAAPPCMHCEIKGYVCVCAGKENNG